MIILIILIISNKPLYFKLTKNYLINYKLINLQKDKILLLEFNNLIGYELYILIIGSFFIE